MPSLEDRRHVTEMRILIFQWAPGKYLSWRAGKTNR